MSIHLLELPPVYSLGLCPPSINVSKSVHNMPPRLAYTTMYA